LHVAAEAVPCEGGAGPQQCLQVRSSPDAPWELFYDEIEGFEFLPGFESDLLVEIADVTELAEDASALRYSLVELIDQTPMA
jgi:hypothetical protein